MASSCPINNLLVNPFQGRTECEQGEILFQNKPIPLFDDREIRFKMATVDWLTGTKCNSRLFCWPCLLMAIPPRITRCREKLVSYVIGSNSNNDLDEWITSHAQSVLHQNSVRDLRKSRFKHKKDQIGLKMQFLMELLCKFRRSGFGARFDETMLQREKVYMQLTTVQVYVTKNKPFCKCYTYFNYNWNEDDDDEESLKKFQDDLYNYFSQFARAFGVQAAARRTYRLTESPRFRNRVQFHRNLLRAIRLEMMAYIRGEELSRVNYVTLVFLNLEDNFEMFDDKQHVAVFLRYIHRGSLVERCLEIGPLKPNSRVLIDKIQKITTDFELDSKLISVAIDGLQISLEQLEAVAIHLKSQRITLTNSTGLTQFVTQRLRMTSSEVRKFFPSLHDLSAFLPKWRPKLWDVSGKNFAKFHGKHLSLSGACALILRNQFDLITRMQMKSIPLNPIADGTEKWTLVQHCRFLCHFESTILLKFFEMALPRLASLEKRFSRRSGDLAGVNRLIDRFIGNLIRFKETEFERLFAESRSIHELAIRIEPNDELMADLEEDLEPLNYLENFKSPQFHQPEVKQQYSSMLDRMIESMRDSLRIRYSNLGLKRFHCFELLNSNRIREYKLSFPKHLLEQLLVEFPLDFNPNQLRTELTSLYERNLFGFTKVSRLLEFLVSNHLEDLYPETVKLAGLTLTVPSPCFPYKASASSRSRVVGRFRDSSFVYLRHSNVYDEEFWLRCEDRLCQQILACKTFQERVMDRFFQIHP